MTDLKDVRTRPPEAATAAAAMSTTMAQKEANKAKYHVYEHSLRAYASILYLKWPVGFQMVLRGKAVDYKDIKKDLKHVTKYK